MQILDLYQNGLSQEVDTLVDILKADYFIKVRFVLNNIGLQTDVYCSNKLIMTRAKKFSPVIFGNHVTLVEGTPTSSGGSHSWPRPHFEEGHCILQWSNKGFPIFKEVRFCAWKIEILELTRLNAQQ